MTTEMKNLVCPICQQPGTAVYLENVGDEGPTGQMRLQSLDCPSGCWKSPGALGLLATLIEAAVVAPGKPGNYQPTSLTLGDMVTTSLREGVYSVKWRTGQKVGTITDVDGKFHAIHGQVGDAGVFESLIDAVEGLAHAD